MVDPHAFMDALREFHHGQGEDLKAPIFNRRVMDLEKLWELVFAHGGSAQVCLKKRWASIGRCFNPPPSMTNLSFHIKRIFERYLLPFEQLHFPDRAMKTSSQSSSASSSSASSSSCSSSPVQRPVETLSPAFDRPMYIPKKKRSKLSRDSRFNQKKQKQSRPEISATRRTFFGRSINPKEFAMPQTLMRTSTALNVEDCEIQAASALQQMKGFPTLSSTSGLPPVLGPPSTSSTPSDHRTIAVFKPTPEGFFPISIERPTPELRPTSLVIPPSVSPAEMRSGSSFEEKQTKEIERLRKQMRQMQSVILRQESKIQAAESSFVEYKNCLQAIVAQMNPGSGTTQRNDPSSSQTNPPPSTTSSTDPN